MKTLVTKSELDISPLGKLNGKKLHGYSKGVLLCRSMEVVGDTLIVQYQIAKDGVDHNYRVRTITDKYGAPVKIYDRPVPIKGKKHTDDPRYDYFK